MPARSLLLDQSLRRPDTPDTLRRSDRPSPPTSRRGQTDIKRTSPHRPSPSPSRAPHPYDGRCHQLQPDNCGCVDDLPAGLEREPILIPLIAACCLQIADGRSAFPSQVLADREGT
ncbi:hypothetical protein CALCODRAFT_491477 [Calocera cornea HHB12733]|uniref:Uncharacterized protein n=1 Tax=Calocera cornea HHB12733 TaxID=1353952 RepID=A0A165J4D2_9BASI|nr:hypothetical protein CALCODRAFT_491477 [Calocera cornea HHB12733]